MKTKGVKRVSLDADKLRIIIEKTRSKAEEYLNDPEKAKGLLEEALKKARSKTKSKGPLDDVWDVLTTFLRLFQAYIQREYTEIPWGSIVMVTVAILYFVMPFDLIPDFIPVAGFIDDVAVIAYVVKQIRADLDRFSEWEKQKNTTA